LPAQPADAEASDLASMRRWLAARAQPITPPGRLNRAVDATIDALVLRCLAEDPGRRFASPAELAGQLADYLSPRQRATRWVRRNRRGVLAGSLAAAAAALAGGVYWSRLPPYYEVKYREGLALHTAGQYQAAIEAFNESLERNRENPDAREARAESYYRLGLAHYDAGSYADAIVVLTNSLADQPKSVAVLFARGQSHYRAGNLPAAREDFVAAANIQPRGLFWFCAGACSRLERASIAYLHKALDANYQPAVVHCNLGVVLMSQNMQTSALPEFTLAIDLNPKLQQPRIELAELLSQSADKDIEQLNQAIAHITAAEELGPRTRRLHWLGAKLHTLAMRESPQAVEEAERHFRAMRSLDNPASKYGGRLKELFLAKPELADVMPDPSFRFVPDPESGIPPPASADLATFDEQ
jgi:tetratricopeptide (TPR) repeat protein